MADVVKDVLKQVSEQNEKFKSTDVHKDIPLEIDIGNLLSVDSNPIDLSKFRSKKETFLKALTRDNTQLLINKIWELPSERHEDVIVAKLPEPTTIIPRINRLPKTRTLTKWQDFAKTKGIKKRKKDKLVWDKVVKDWRPRYGYKRVTSDTDNWVMEYKKNEDPYTDLFAKKAGEKSERVAKNELQRLRNIARSQNKRVPGVGLTPTETPDAAAVSKAIVVAKSSTASLGRYTETLPKEKPQKRTGAKRKFDPVIGDIRAEKLKNLEIFDKIKKNEPKINVDKVANTQIHNEEVTQAEKHIAGKTKKKFNGNRKGAKGKFNKDKKGNFTKGKAGGKDKNFSGNKKQLRKGKR